MSYGEDIIATGEARLARKENPDAKIVFGDPDLLEANNGDNFKMHWSEMYKNNPNILQLDEDAEEVVVIPNFPKHRPYINYKKTKYGAAFGDDSQLLKIAYDLDFKLMRGDLYFTEEEMAIARQTIKDLEPPYIFVDPHSTFPNKDWLWERWENVVENSSYNFIQLKFDENEQPLKGATQIKTQSSREVCAILNVCTGKGITLSTNSDIYHAAAALKMPAIVLWSHYGHPDILGYDDHINIRWDAAGDPCGLRSPCVQCKLSMEMIKVGDVLLAIDTIMKSGVIK